MGMDCINQKAVSDRDCSHCIWHTSGQCANWNCEPVSRKEALEALEKVKNATPMVLPPEQSTHSNTPNMLEALDCISRQNAVDIINGYEEQFNGYIGTPNDSEVYAYARGLLLSIERNISALPSAQSEIVRCEECEHKMECYGDVIMKSIGFGTVYCPLEYCSEGKRKDG